MNLSIEKAVAELRLAERRLRQVVATNQKCCKHKYIAECNYIPSVGYGCFAPIRICLSCGITEEGWGCGYLVLTGEATSIDRNELYKKRQGLMIVEKHKGPLLRKEATVIDFINGLEPEEN